ncbi:MAG: ATP-binding protein [Acidimicrobiales bacterium]
MTAASNNLSSEWGATFTDPLLAAAVAVDRLTFRAHVVEAGTDSCRLRAARARNGTTPRPRPRRRPRWPLNPADG